jgi:hypothetical protein
MVCYITTYPMWLWGHRLLKISLPGSVLHGIKWFLWCPHKWSSTLHSECRINEGLIQRGSTIDHWRSQCEDRILWPTPYTHTYTTHTQHNTKHTQHNTHTTQHTHSHTPQHRHITTLLYSYLNQLYAKRENVNLGKFFIYFSSNI